MSMNSKSILKFDDFFKKHMNLICIIFAIILFIVGVIISTNFIFKLPTDEDFQKLEQVALSVYNTDNMSIYEIPNSFKIDKSEDATLYISDFDTTGSVTATLENNDLMLKRHTRMVLFILMAFIVGIVFICMGYIILTIFCFIYTAVFLYLKREHRND